MTVLAILGAAALGTAFVAPFIELGLPAISLAAVMMQLVACVLLIALPRLER